MSEAIVFRVFCCHRSSAACSRPLLLLSPKAYEAGTPLSGKCTRLQLLLRKQSTSGIAYIREKACFWHCFRILSFRVSLGAKHNNTVHRGRVSHRACRRVRFQAKPRNTNHSSANRTCLVGMLLSDPLVDRGAHPNTTPRPVTPFAVAPMYFKINTLQKVD